MTPRASAAPETGRERREFGTLRLRGRIWWLRYRIQGRTHEESTGSTSRREAEKLLARRAAEHGLGQLTAPDARRVTFADLVQMIRDDYAVKGNRSGRRLELSVRQLATVFGSAKALAITADRVTAYEVRRLGDGAARATVNAELAALRRMFRLAVDARRLPAGAMPRITTPKPKNARRGFFEPEDFAAVLAELPAPLRPVMQFAAMTGWRVMSEVVTLRWEQVDFKAGTVRLEPNTTKNDEGRTFPFAALPALAALLQAQREATTALERAAGRVIPWVFHRDGAPIRSYDAAWRGACQRAAKGTARGTLALATRAHVAGRLVHDLRRTAVRNLTRAGVPEGIAMKITGHRTRAVFDRYDIVNDADLRTQVDRLNTYLAAQDPSHPAGTPAAAPTGTREGQSPLALMPRTG